MTSRRASVQMHLRHWEESIRRQDFQGAVKSLEAARTLLRRGKDHHLLSHVEKLIEDARWARTRRTKPTSSSVPPACAFCLRSRPAVAQLVAGPGVFVCNECVAESIRQGPRRTTDSPLPHLVKCSFCGRKRVSRAIVLVREKVAACQTCMDIAAEVLVESEHQRAQPARPAGRRRIAGRRRVVW